MLSAVYSNRSTWHYDGNLVQQTAHHSFPIFNTIFYCFFFYYDQASCKCNLWFMLARARPMQTQWLTSVHCGKVTSTSINAMGDHQGRQCAVARSIDEVKVEFNLCFEWITRWTQCRVLLNLLRYVLNPQHYYCHTVRLPSPDGS